jgi:hypothetical protein
MVALALQDDLFLHAHDESGKLLIHRTTLDIGLTGAAFIQLWLAERVDLVESLVVVRHSQPTGDPVCDRVLAAILSLDNAHAPRTWVGWLNEDIYERVGDHLVELGILSRVTTRRLGVVAKTRYAATDRDLVVRLHGRTRYTVLGFESPDMYTAALCGLIAVLGLEGGLYVNRPAGEVLARLEAIARTNAAEVREIITAVDDAVASASVSMYR